MKYIATMILALACLTATAADIGTAPPFEPVTLNTNTSPLLSGPFVDILDKLTTATNWGVAVFSLQTPHSKSTGNPAWGGGALFLYNFNSYFGAGLGIDYMDGNTTMPSAQMQLSAPLYVGGTNGVRVTPFGFTGIATPISGADYQNGSPVGIFGAGLGVRITGGLNAFYAIEQRTGEPSLWNVFGLTWSKSF
jgi:hypothetical protein